jgi:hypothetical protein
MLLTNLTIFHLYPYLSRRCVFLCRLLVVSWQFVSAHCWLYLGSLFVYIVGLYLGSLCTLLCCILAVCFCTLFGCILAVCVHCWVVLAACFCTLLGCILTFVCVHCWVVSWQFVYIVLYLGSLFTLLGCVLAACLCTLLSCVLAVCVHCVVSWQFVYVVSLCLGSFFVYPVVLYLGSLSIYAQLRMQCCNVLRNVTACLGLHKTMYEVSVSFSSFVTCDSHYNMIYILHSLFICVENNVMCKMQTFCFLGIVNVITWS